MKQMNDEHKKSLDRAVCILGLALQRQKVPKYQAELGRDIKHLMEVKAYVEHEINVPMFTNLRDEACELAT